MNHCRFPGSAHKQVVCDCFPPDLPRVHSLTFICVQHLHAFFYKKNQVYVITNVKIVGNYVRITRVASGRFRSLAPFMTNLFHPQRSRVASCDHIWKGHLSTQTLYLVINLSWLFSWHSIEVVCHCLPPDILFRVHSLASSLEPRLRAVCSIVILLDVVRPPRRGREVGLFQGTFALVMWK